MKMIDIKNIGKRIGRAALTVASFSAHTSYSALGWSWRTASKAVGYVFERVADLARDHVPILWKTGMVIATGGSLAACISMMRNTNDVEGEMPEIAAMGTYGRTLPTSLPPPNKLVGAKRSFTRSVGGDSGVRSTAEILNIDFSFTGSWNKKKIESFKNRKWNWDKEVEVASKIHGVDPDLLRAVIHIESRGNHRAGSHAGAVGLMQMMPRTAKAMGVRNRRNPQDNINGGAKLLARLLKKYDGDLRKTLAAYNWGSGNLAKRTAWPRETRKYVRSVTSIYAWQKKQGGQDVKYKIAPSVAVPAASKTPSEQAAYDAVAKKHFKEAVRSAKEKKDGLTKDDFKVVFQEAQRRATAELSGATPKTPSL